ncbi:MAG: TetR/AcrR family transcriptional regulator, partial [Microbacteriaceae bacterium]|nr:TetR/AcrR family transcriptional regulator [Microbacteriaceae bacterium]
MADAGTARERGKADRTAALLDAATTLFAQRGFAGVSLEQLGAAVGVSGPAVYRHFANKQAVLAAVLHRASSMLLAGGQRVVATGDALDEQLRMLVAFHVDFALASTDVIRMQDRDLSSLTSDARHEVRRIQREYVELWVTVLRGLHPEESAARLRVRAHAGFGLMNSTPH